MVSLTFRVFNLGMLTATRHSRLPRYVAVFCPESTEASMGICVIPFPYASSAKRIPARNNLRAMRKGDLAFFYHSNCKVPAIVGVMEVVKEHSPDCK